MKAKVHHLEAETLTIQYSLENISADEMEPNIEQIMKRKDWYWLLFMLSYHQAWVVVQVEDHAISRLRHNQLLGLLLK